MQFSWSVGFTTSNSITLHLSVYLSRSLSPSSSLSPYPISLFVFFSIPLFYLPCLSFRLSLWSSLISSHILSCRVPSAPVPVPISQVNSGFECGLALTSFSDFQDGDEVECMKVVWKTRTLSLLDGASGSIYDPTKEKKKTNTPKNKKQNLNSY